MNIGQRVGPRHQDASRTADRRVEGADQFVLSADSRRAYLLSLQIQGDVWRMDIK